MVKMIKWAIPMILFSHIATAAIIEKDATIFSDYNNQKMLNALQSLVRLNGYRCDSISAAMPFLFSKGITLTCNHYDYVFDIADHGGKWEVTVE